MKRRILLQQSRNTGWVPGLFLAGLALLGAGPVAMSAGMYNWPILIGIGVLLLVGGLALWHATPYLEVSADGMRVLPVFYYSEMSVLWHELHSWHVERVSDISRAEGGGESWIIEQVIILRRKKPGAQMTWTGTFAVDAVINVLREYAPEKEANWP